jgi:hypothetical protein
MATGRLSFWVVWLFSRLVLLIAALLILLVIIAPWLHNTSAQDIGSRLLRLFAGDRAVRRTALASAVGLIVTARIFFRVPRTPRRLWPKARQPRSSYMAGA